jgi:hypothetical protein
MNRERIEQVIKTIKDADHYDESISEPQSTTALTAVQDALPLLEEMLAKMDRAATEVPEFWWSPTVGMWRRTLRGPMLKPGFEMVNDQSGEHFREQMPADALRLTP